MSEEQMVEVTYTGTADSRVISVPEGTIVVHKSVSRTAEVSKELARVLVRTGEFLTNADLTEPEVQEGTEPEQTDGASGTTEEAAAQNVAVDGNPPPATEKKARQR